MTIPQSFSVARREGKLSLLNVFMKQSGVIRVFHDVITWLPEFDAVLSKSRMLRDMAISSAALPLALKTKRGLHFESLLTTN